MKLTTKEEYMALTDEQIATLTEEECNEALEYFDYDDEFYEKLCTQMHKARAIEQMNYFNPVTVGQMREWMKDLNDDDIVQLYDTYNETGYDPFEVFVPAQKDKDGKSHIIFMIDTD